MGNILFLTLGTRDIQYVYEADDNIYIRTKTGNKDINTIDTYYSLEQISHELNPKNKNDGKIFSSLSGDGIEPVGIVFPMLEKTFKLLQTEDVNNISTLYLISTDRSEILGSTFQNTLDDLAQDDSDEKVKYAANVIKRYSKDDKTSKFSEYITAMLQDNSSSFRENQYTSGFLIPENIRQFKMGKNSPVLKSLGQRLQASSDAESKISILSEADFNTRHFIQDEIVRFIEPDMGNIFQAERIFFSLTGGMGKIIQATENLITRLIKDHEIPIDILYIPESDVFPAKKIPDRSMDELFSSYTRQNNKNLIGRHIVSLFKGGSSFPLTLTTEKDELKKNLGLDFEGDNNFGHFLDELSKCKIDDTSFIEIQKFSMRYVESQMIKNNINSNIILRRLVQLFCTCWIEFKSITCPIGYLFKHYCDFNGVITKKKLEEFGNKFTIFGFGATQKFKIDFEYDVGHGDEAFKIPCVFFVLSLGIIKYTFKGDQKCVKWKLKAKHGTNTILNSLCFKTARSNISNNLRADLENNDGEFIESKFISWFYVFNQIYEITNPTSTGTILEWETKII